MPGGQQTSERIAPAGNRWSTGITTLCELLLAAMAVLVTASVLMRELAGVGWSFTEEVSGFQLVAISFLGLAAAHGDSAIFRVDTLFSRLPQRWQARLDLAWDATALVFTLVLALLVGLHAYSSYVRGVASTDVTGTPLWVPQAIMPAGLLLLAAALLGSMRARLRARGDAQGKTP